MNKKTIILIAIGCFLIATGSAISQPDTLWTKQYQARIEGSNLLHDGGYAYTGRIYGIENDSSVAGRFDTEGEIVWESTIEEDTYYNRVIETPDSGIAVLGKHREISMIKKFDWNGELLYYWEFELGFGRHDFTGLLNDGEGGYIVSGYEYTSGQNSDDFFLLRVSAEGEVEWQRTYRERWYQECYGMTAIPNGGFLLVGYTNVRNYSYEFNVIRTDEEGEIIWQNHYGAEWLEENEFVSREFGNAVTLTEEGNIVIAGSSYIVDDNELTYPKIFMIKIDLDGEIIWMDSIDHGQNETEISRSITNTVDGGFVLTGYSRDPDGEARRFFLKTDHRGELIWWDIPENDRVSTINYRHFGIYALEDRTFTLIGRNSRGRGLVIKYGTDPQGVSDDDFTILPNYTGLVSAYPNPFNGTATLVFSLGQPAEVDIDIFNALGRRQAALVSGWYPVGSHSLVWDASGMATGVYFARLTQEKQIATAKLLLMK